MIPSCSHTGTPGFVAFCHLKVSSTSGSPLGISALSLASFSPRQSPRSSIRASILAEEESLSAVLLAMIQTLSRPQARWLSAYVAATDATATRRNKRDGRDREGNPCRRVLLGSAGSDPQARRRDPHAGGLHRRRRPQRHLPQPRDPR